MSEPRVIDCNCQFGPWPRAQLDASLGAVLGLLDRAGIGQAVVAHLQGASGDHHAANALTLAACAEHERLIPAGWVSLRRSLNVGAEFAALRERGFRLVRLPREHEGWPVDYAPLWEALRAGQACGLTVMLAALQMGDITALGRLLEAHPCTVIVTGVNTSHTPLVAEAVAVGRNCPTLYFETSRLEGIDTLDVMRENLGAERLVFGTSLPSQYPSSARALVETSGLSDAERAAVYAGNLLRLIGEDG